MTALRGLAAVALLGAVAWAGAARPPATLALALVGALALAAAIAEVREDRPLVGSPLAIPLLAMTVLALAQLVPLPPSLRQIVAPETERMTELVLRGIAHGRWRPITSDVGATLDDAARLAGLTALAIAFGRMGGERHRDVLRGLLIGTLALLVSCALLSAVGVPLPSVLATPLRTRGLVPFPFVNPNHAASLLALTLPVTLGLAIRQTGVRALGLYALVLAGNAALGATLSRAGIAVALVAEGLTVWLAIREGEGGRRRLLYGVSAAAVTALLIVGSGPMITRLGHGGGPGRLQVAHDALLVVRDHWRAGVGRGAFSLVFARYSALAAHNRFAFAENEYLQIVLDFGVLGALFVVLAVAVAAKHAARALKRISPGGRAALVGLGAVAVHNLVDFSWETGGVAAASCAAAALAFVHAGRPVARGVAGAWVLLTIGLCVAAATPLGRSAEHEGERLELAARGDDREAFVAQAERALLRHPMEGYLADVAAARLLADRDRRAFAWLDRALLVGPYDPIAHRLTARALVASGLRDQAAVELQVALRDADDHDWLAGLTEALALFSGDEDGKPLAASLPDDGRSHHAVLDLLVQRGRWAAVAVVAQSAVSLRPDDGFALRMLVRAALAVKSYAELAEHAHQLVSVAPTGANVTLAAEALVAVGQSGEAERLLDGVLSRVRPEELVEPAVLRARLSVERGDFAGASALLESAIARQVDARDGIRLHLALADVYDRAGRQHRAAAERAEAARLQDR